MSNMHLHRAMALVSLRNERREDLAAQFNEGYVDTVKLEIASLIDFITSQNCNIYMPVIQLLVNQPRIGKCSKMIITLIANIDCLPSK